MNARFRLWKEEDVLRWEVLSGEGPGPQAESPAGQVVEATTLLEAAVKAGLVAPAQQWFVVWRDQLLDDHMSLPAADLGIHFARALQRERYHPVAVQALSSLAALEQVFGSREQRRCRASNGVAH